MAIPTAHQEEVMIFGLSPQIFEDRLFPVSFHIVPIIDHTVSDGIMNAITRCLRVRKGFVADKEIKVFDSTLRCEMSWLGGNSGCSRRLR